MCNVIKINNANKPYLKNRPLGQVFSQDVMRTIPYHTVQEGHCVNPQCGRRLSHEEMWPRNRATPRALCPECYHNLTSMTANRCFVCGDYLDQQKVYAQGSQPREISHRLHDGYCKDYFSLVSCKALGEDVSYVVDDQRALPTPRRFQLPAPSRQEVYEPEIIDNYNGRPVVMVN